MSSIHKNQKPTGVEIIDTLLGGIAPKQTYMHCAPTGQGKTTLALQLVAEIAKQEFSTGKRRCCLYLNLEYNSTAGAFLYSAGANVDRCYFFKPKSYVNSPEIEQIKARLEQFDCVAKHCLRFEDLRERLSDRPNRIRQIANRLQPLALVVVDSLSALVDLDATDLGQSIYGKTYHEKAKVLKSIAVDFNCPIWITHQLSPEQNRTEKGSRPDVNQTFGCKTLWQAVSTGFASGMLNQFNRACFQSRDVVNKGKQLVGYLQSDVARWSLASDHHIWNGKVRTGREIVVRQKYLQPGWDPRAAGFAV